jgi:hypothetical protein
LIAWIAHAARVAAGRRCVTGDIYTGSGQVMDKISHSKYWKDSAIFVVEDDSQAGVDHVGHRADEPLRVVPDP